MIVCSAPNYLEDHAEAHGVENAVLLQKSYLAQMVHVRLILYREEGRLHPHHQDEDQTENDVTAIGDDVVEILKYPPRPGATVI